MITYQVNGTGDTISYEEKSLPYAQALEMETQTGVTASKYLTQLDEGSAKSTAILMWLGAVNHAAARDGVSFRDAARALTFDQFTEDLDVLATMATVRRPVPAADPTPAGSGSAEPTSPGTSEQLPPSAPSPAPAAATSDSSPTTSASVPGSGTSSTSPTSNP